MQKEIFEQPESVVNTMRGRVQLETGNGEEFLSQLSNFYNFQFTLMYMCIYIQPNINVVR